MAETELKPGQVFNIYVFDSGNAFLTNVDISCVDKEERISYSKEYNAVGAIKIKSLKHAQAS